MTTRTPLDTLMSVDMREQPAVLTAMLHRRSNVHSAVNGLVRECPRSIAIVGRGSSSNAGLYGRILFEVLTGVAVNMVPPSMSRLYGPREDHAGVLALGLSQSGRTTDVAETLAWLRSTGATTIGITAYPSSPIGDTSDLILELPTGLERSVPATKTFTAELAMLAMIAEAVGRNPWSDGFWGATIDAVEEVLDDREPVRAAASVFDTAAHVSVIGAGMLVGVALEGALKILEAARLPATGWSASAFRHGPLTLAGPGEPVVAVQNGGLGSGDVADVLDLVGDAPRILIGEAAGVDLRLLRVLPEAMTAIPAAVRLQQLALETAIRRGVNPDRPPRLAKVAES